MPSRRTRWLVLAASLLALPAQASEPILHEYFEPHPAEDLRLGATTPDGTMPAALDTPSGVVPAPTSFRNPYSAPTAYGGGSTPDSVDATYRIDRNTTRPDVVGYDDPFSPSVAPFKRLYAYDSVNDALELVVADKKLEKLSIGGSVNVGEDQFYGDLFVDLAQNVPVRIPSVGPDARVLAVRVDAPMNFQLVRDGADNWFIVAPIRKRVRLILQLAIARAVFGSQMAKVSWSELRAKAPPLPEPLRPQARQVLSDIGVSDDLTPNEAVRRLVAYFRSFAPSNELPKATSGINLYKELVDTRKGVCRHRAYAFVLTALELGIPSRLVRNEAHAWVEVHDGSLWHRIDLGGAAGRMEFDQDPSAQSHQPPGDPYPWPETATSGQQMADRAMLGVLPGPSGSAPTTTPSPTGSAGDTRAVPQMMPPLSQPDASVHEPNESSKPSAELTLIVNEREVQRGAPVGVRGLVTADEVPCRFARVDIVLRAADGSSILVGALPTDENGRYAGKVTIPYNVDVGDYKVMATTPGIGQCGAGQTQ